MLSYNTNHKPHVGSGMGQAPATDEAAEEQDDELTDQHRAPMHGGDACSQPKPAEPSGEGSKHRRAGKCSKKARDTRHATFSIAPVEEDLDLEKKYVIEPNTPTSAANSDAKLKAFLRAIGTTSEIQEIIAKKIEETIKWRMKDNKGSCASISKTSSLRVELARPQDADVLPVTTDDGENELMPITDWQDVEIEITLDSGCCEHVMDMAEAPGYVVTESPGSRRKQNFVVGNGQKVPNEGQFNLNLQTQVNGHENLLRSCFQVAEITRPLMSVSRICDQDLVCEFDKKEARIKDQNGATICVFERRGGLYVTTMKLKQPDSGPNSTPFARQGA